MVDIVVVDVVVGVVVEGVVVVDVVDVVVGVVVVDVVVVLRVVVVVVASEKDESKQMIVHLIIQFLLIEFGRFQKYYFLCHNSAVIGTNDITSLIVALIISLVIA